MDPGTVPTTGTRTHCTSCGVELNEETAYRRPRSTTWVSRCRVCTRTYRRAWRAEVRAARYVAPTAACSVCGSTDVLTPRGRVRLDATDRDPATGTDRGLLCPGCRTGLAGFSRDPDRLRAAATYLELAQEDSPPAGEPGGIAGQPK